MICPYFDEGCCRSCSLLPLSCDVQLKQKSDHCRSLLSDPAIAWLPPVTSPETGFRNKAKMAVGGTIERPVLGLFTPGKGMADLTGCPLYPESLRASFAPLAAFITAATLSPYDIPKRRGELKYLLVTLAEHSGRLMVRFVLRSREAVGRIRKKLPLLVERLPNIETVSANIQPIHQAILEGEEEIFLGGEEALSMEVNGLLLFLRPGGFFQTNTAVAASLYRQGKEWVDEFDPASLWDLFCGAGGFALHCADGRRRVTGIEASAEAVAGACWNREVSGLGNLEFIGMDVEKFIAAPSSAPEMIVVNPPRRGLGEALCRYLDSSGVQRVIYSSCNTESLAADLNRMPGWRVERARLLDMFPHTTHYEVITLLVRRGGES